MLQHDLELRIAGVQGFEGGEEIGLGGEDRGGGGLAVEVEDEGIGEGGEVGEERGGEGRG